MDAAIADTFKLERLLTSAPAAVFDAFADPAKKRGWFADGGHHDVVEFSTDLRIGGVETSAYQFKPGGPFEGMILSSTGVFLDVEFQRRIVLASSMSLGDDRISAALITVELEGEPRGTRLTLTHQAVFFEGADGPELRRVGWNTLLDRLEEAL